ncbi:Hypothetical predicted protein [Olea europaea subsp. europaea]|uniref:Uncharacterized protein n=1 Tax=Olea europaea subsp. europaea TaxID=158383 RepID=A0A8S0RA28_OLEEU|nr:Hypothetical predicted protein [Olea europaea subsp. europaea]
MPFTLIIGNLQSKQQKLEFYFFLAFVGMTEIRGWESRGPIVAKCDRKRVLSSWGPHCVSEGAQSRRCCGRAAGDASDLVQLCKEYGIEAYIINPVMDKNQDSADINYSNSKEQGQVSCTLHRTIIDMTEIHLELNDLSASTHFTYPDLELLGVTLVGRFDVA